MSKIKFSLPSISLQNVPVCVDQIHFKYLSWIMLLHAYHMAKKCPEPVKRSSRITRCRHHQQLLNSSSFRTYVYVLQPIPMLHSYTFPSLMSVFVCHVWKKKLTAYCLGTSECKSSGMMISCIFSTHKMVADMPLALILLHFTQYSLASMQLS